MSRVRFGLSLYESNAMFKYYIMFVCFAESIPKMCSAHVQSLMDWMDSKTARQSTEQVQP